MSFLTDGHPTLIGFELAPSIKFKPKTVKPPGWDGGGPNNTTTMLNNSLETQQPKKLKKMTNSTASCAYDPQVLDDIRNIVNVLQLITVTFPDGSTWAFYGWLDKFEPGVHRGGEQPTADVTIESACQNASYVETNPVYTPGP